MDEVHDVHRCLATASGSTGSFGCGTWLNRIESLRNMQTQAAHIFIYSITHIARLIELLLVAQRIPVSVLMFQLCDN
jgi:hypothetical protein